MESAYNKPLWKKILILVGCLILVEILFMNLGQYTAFYLFRGFLNNLIINDTTGAVSAGVLYSLFIGIWLVVILTLLIVKPFRPILKAIGTKPKGNNWKMLLFGTFLGLGFNSLCAFLAMLHGDIQIAFHEFNLLYIVILFILVFIQSSAEELVYRGFLYQITTKYFKSPAIILLLNPIMFAAAHLSNDGMDVVSFLSITFIGMLFTLMVYYLDSIWCAFAFHAAWNFSQAFIWGLPNSGLVSTYSIFKLTNGIGNNSFFYSNIFGIEATWFAVILIIVACIAFYYWGKKNDKKPTNIWEESENH